MAEPYFERLVSIVDRLELASDSVVALEAKHFFSGAALYAGGKICALLSPEGLALKVPADLRGRLIEEGRGNTFRFFPDGPVKREYVTVPDITLQDELMLRELISASIRYVAGEEDLK